MATHARNVNFAVLAAFVVAVLAAGAAIFYFGGGTDEVHDALPPETLAPDVQGEVRDGLSPDLSLSQQRSDEGR